MKTDETASPGDIPPSASDNHTPSTTSSRDSSDNIPPTVEGLNRESELSNNKAGEAQSAAEESQNKDDDQGSTRPLQHRIQLEVGQAVIHEP